MKQPRKIRAVSVMKALLAAATLLLAALLIVQCADIYAEGTSAENLTEAGVRVRAIYSREIVAERFNRISWLFVVWAALLALALVAKALCPEPPPKQVAIPSAYRMERALTRFSVTPAMRAQERRRRVAAVLCAAACAVCAAFAGAYMLNPSHFVSRELESVMGEMLRHILPWIAIAFAVLALYARISDQSLLRELEAAKTAPRRNPAPPKARKPAIRLAAQIVLLAASALLIIAGVLNGGMYDVLVKAINICTECIGLG